MIDEALDTVQGVASGAFWADARSAAECHEEAPFSVLDDREGIPMVLAGVVDLVHRTVDGWKIVDYKTDRDSAALAARYAGQIAEYERAWRRFVPEAVTSVLVSTRPNEPDRQTPHS